MTLTSSKRGDVLIVAWTGKLDATACDELDQRLKAILLPTDKWVVFDLSGLEYIGSAGIRIFLKVVKQLKAAGGRARFCGLNDTVRTVFNVIGLSFHTDLFPTLDEALKNFPN